jgi:hypothetical protein
MGHRRDGGRNRGFQGVCSRRGQGGIGLLSAIQFRPTGIFTLEFTATRAAMPTCFRFSNSRWIPEIGAGIASGELPMTGIC